MSEEWEEGILATFEVRNDRFKIWITNPDTIKQVFDLQEGRSFASIPLGPILNGSGYKEHNAPWKWHLDPQKTIMAEFAMELCDGTPSYVESTLPEWVNNIKTYCPWSAKLVEIKDFR